ncbi:MAG: hypothetical protein Q9181_001432 [Wetmoreana brouardii]
MPCHAKMSYVASGLADNYLIHLELEGESLSVDLKEEDPVLVGKLVHYLYHFDYVDDDKSEDNDNGTKDHEGHPAQQSSESCALSINTGMYVMGDRYNLVALKNLARAKFSAALPSGWKQDNFPNVIRIIYDQTLTTDRGLRDRVLPVLQAHWQELRTRKAFMAVVQDHAEFAVELIEAWAKTSQLLEGKVVKEVISKQDSWYYSLFAL